MKHNRIIYIVGIVGLATLILMLTITSPTGIGPLGVLLFFTTLYLVFFCVISLLLQAFVRLAFKRKMLKKKDYLYSAVMSFGPIMLLMARSFGVITPWTISLVVIFLFLAEFLVAKSI